MSGINSGDYIKFRDEAGEDHLGVVAERCFVLPDECLKVTLLNFLSGSKHVPIKNVLEVEMTNTQTKVDEKECDELAEYKQKVRAVATKLAQENDWCDEVDQALKNDLDIPEGLQRTKIRAVFEFEVDEDVFDIKDSGSSLAVDLAYSSNLNDLKENLKSAEVIRE